MVSSVLATLQTTVNMFWVGKLGAREIAAVALAGSVLGVFQTLAGIISAGTLATCARFAGADDRKGIQESLFHSLILALAISSGLAAVTSPLALPLLKLFGAETAVVELGRPFLALLLAVMPVFFCSLALGSTFQALGDTRTPMWVWLAANAVNLVLDPFLILGWLHAPRLGVFGAALATAISQFVALAALATILYRRGLIKFNQPVRPRVFGALLAIGAPASLQAITRPLTGMLMFRIITSFGSGTVAAFGVGLRILNTMYIYLTGLGSACQILVGQNLGAGKPETAAAVAGRVLRVALLLQAVVLTILFVLAPWAIRIFNTNPDVVRYGVSYLRVLTPFLILLGLSTAWSGAQYGAGATKPTMLAAVVANWLVKLPLAYILSRMTSLRVTGVWLGIGLSILVETAIVGIAFSRGGWREKKVTW
jgi:putative MATE family efflux protein